MSVLLFLARPQFMEESGSYRIIFKNKRLNCLKNVCVCPGKGGEGWRKKGKEGRMKTTGRAEQARGSGSFEGRKADDEDGAKHRKA